jgi:hypothetical protein
MMLAGRAGAGSWFHPPPARRGGRGRVRGAAVPALVELMGDAGLVGAVGQGVATVEAHRWHRMAQGWGVEVYPVVNGR